jgi:hypothetical protein
MMWERKIITFSFLLILLIHSSMNVDAATNYKSFSDSIKEGNSYSFYVEEITVKPGYGLVRPIINESSIKLTVTQDLSDFEYHDVADTGRLSEYFDLQVDDIEFTSGGFGPTLSIGINGTDLGFDLFFSINLIFPTTIHFDNGTERNYFEYLIGDSKTDPEYDVISLGDQWYQYTTAEKDFTFHQESGVLDYATFSNEMFSITINEGNPPSNKDSLNVQPLIVILTFVVLVKIRKRWSFLSSKTSEENLLCKTKTSMIRIIISEKTRKFRNT